MSLLAAVKLNPQVGSVRWSMVLLVEQAESVAIPPGSFPEQWPVDCLQVRLAPRKGLALSMVEAK
jgi:hypothetical protein